MLEYIWNMVIIISNVNTIVCKNNTDQNDSQINQLMRDII